MSVRRIRALGIVLGAATLGLSACVSSSGTEEEAAGAASSTGADGGDEPVSIGVVMATSGFMGPIDSPALNAMLLEVETMNAAGGIDGHPVEIDFVDTGTKLDRYASAATEVLDRGAKVLVVTCDYDVSSPASLVAEGKNVLNIAPCVGDPVYGPDGGLEIGFSMGDGTPGEASIMAEFSNSKGWRNAVLLKDTTLKYTQNQCDIFAKRFTALGGTVAATYEYKQGDSIQETVSRISSAGAPDVVVNCGYSPGGAQVAKELRDGGVASPIVSGFGMDGDFWTESIPGLADYYVVTYAAKNGDDPDQAVNDAAAAYEAEYGARPDVGGFVTGPSTLQAIKAAYEQSGSWDGDKMAAAMEAFDGEPLLAGPTSFSPELHISVDRPMRVLVVADGKLAFVEQRAAETVEYLG